MQIPTLNPLRFYKPNATKLKDNLSFADSSDYWNDLPGAYTPKFRFPGFMDFRVLKNLLLRVQPIRQSKIVKCALIQEALFIQI